MGSYRISREEIREALIKMLDELEGNVYHKDFENAFKDVFNKYKYFSDKKRKRRK